jgi:hypothetical protein
VVSACRKAVLPTTVPGEIRRKHFYGVFKRGMKGIYKNYAAHRLHRYVAELDFQYNYRVLFGSTTKRGPTLFARDGG